VLLGKHLARFATQYNARSMQDLSTDGNAAGGSQHWCSHLCQFNRIERPASWCSDLQLL